MTDWQKATIINIKQASEDMLSITVTPKQWTPHKAGQCYEIRIPGSKLMRKYSIVSAPHQKDQLEFGVQLLPYGAVSPKMWDLKAGNQLDIRGPFGTFTWEPSHKGPLVLIAGGSGITPLISIYNYARTHRPKDEVVFIVNAKRPSRIMHYQKFKKHLITRFTETEGRVDEAFFDQAIGKFMGDQTTRFYVCGPDDFAGSTINILLKMGFADKTIISEGFS